MSKTIISLSNKCFAQCIHLSSITLSSSLTSIGSKCFYQCQSLQSIELPSSLSSIGNNCFSYCSQLSSIQFPKKQLFLGKDCVSYCLQYRYDYLPLLYNELIECGIKEIHRFQLEEWTQKKCKEIIFHSKYHSWDSISSSFHSQLYNRSNVLFIIQTKTFQTFGCYITSSITEFYPNGIIDSNAFLFVINQNDIIQQYPCLSSSSSTQFICKIHDLSTYSNLLTI